MHVVFTCNIMNCIMIYGMMHNISRYSKDEYAGCNGHMVNSDCSVRSQHWAKQQAVVLLYSAWIVHPYLGQFNNNNNNNNENGSGW